MQKQYKKRIYRIMEKVLRWLFHILELLWGNINDLHDLLQNLHPKIKFTIEPTNFRHSH